MTGSDIPADFINSTYYRPFADLSAPENPATVMTSVDVTQNLTPTPILPLLQRLYLPVPHGTQPINQP